MAPGHSIPLEIGQQLTGEHGDLADRLAYRLDEEDEAFGEETLDGRKRRLVWQMAAKLLLNEDGDDDSDYESDDDEVEEMLRVDNNMHRPKKQRKACPIMWTDTDGSTRRLLPRQTFWYNAYVEHPQLEDAKFQVKFRSRFRLCRMLNTRNS